MMTGPGDAALIAPSLDFLLSSADDQETILAWERVKEGVRTFNKDIGLLPIAGLGLLRRGLLQLDFTERLRPGGRDGFLGRGNLDGSLLFCWDKEQRLVIILAIARCGQGRVPVREASGRTFARLH
jgi:hypothetical protein